MVALAEAERATLSVDEIAVVDFCLAGIRNDRISRFQLRVFRGWTGSGLVCAGLVDMGVSLKSAGHLVLSRSGWGEADEPSSDDDHEGRQRETFSRMLGGSPVAAGAIDPLGTSET
jgi:hypothetical protein